MASDAEVDLVINASGALPEVERDLARIISIAERNSDDIDVQAAVNVRDSLDSISSDLDRVLRRAEAGASDIDVLAVLDQQRSIRALRSTVNNVVNQVNTGAPDINLTTLVDRTRSLRNVRRDLDNIVRVAQAAAPDIDVDVDVDDDSLRRATTSLLRFGRTAAQTTGSIAGLAAGGVALGASLGSLAPLLASIASAAAQVAPATAIGVSGMATMQLAAGTLKIAMIGVEDAITSAFDPDVKPEDLAEQMERLAPEARAFVTELVDMRKELGVIQQRVQGNFFRGFDDAIRRLASSLGKDLTQGLDNSSRSLNRMVLNAAGAVQTLGDNGTFNKAIDSSTRSMQALERVPAQITLGLGQLAAAAGPSMERLSKAVATRADEISGRLAAAFESGRLEDAIDEALDTLIQFGSSIKTIFKGIGNIFSGLTQDGRGLFDILQSIAVAFEELTASSEFQLILGELAAVADALVANVLPLLREAFVQLGPVIEELGPPLRDFINEIGPELIPVIKELGPILLDLAKMLREQMPFAIEFTKSALGVLVVALRSVHLVLDAIVLPIVRAVAQVLNSDFAKAVRGAAQISSDEIDKILGSFQRFRTSVFDTIGSAITRVGQFAGATGEMVGEVVRATGKVLDIFLDLPSNIADAMGNVQSLLFNKGQQIVSGLIDGLVSQLGRLKEIASEIGSIVSDTVSGVLGIFSPSRVFIEIGENTIAGFVEGLKRSMPDLQFQAERMGLTVTDAGRPRQAPVILPSRREEPPVVYVNIGNERLRAFVDTRVSYAQRGREAQLIKGVRR